MAEVKLDVKVFPLAEPLGNLKAFARITVNDLVAISGLRINDSEKGLFVSMPQTKGKDGKYHDIAYPVDGDLRKQISKAVLDEFAALDRQSDRKPLAEGLREGAAKAAEQAATQQPAAKARPAEIG